MKKMEAIEKCVPKALACISILLNLLNFILRIWMIRIIKIIFDGIVANETVNLGCHILSFVILALAVRLLYFLISNCNNEFLLKLASGLHAVFFGSILEMQVTESQSEFTASIAQRHIPAIERFILQKYIDSKVEAAKFLMAVIYIGLISWQLLLFSILFLPITLLLANILGGKIEALNRSILEIHKQMDQMIMEGLDGADTLRVQNAGAFLIKEFDKKQGRALEQEMELQKKMKLVNEPLLEISSFLMSVSGVFWSGLLSFWGVLSIGSVISLIGFYGNLIDPVIFYMRYGVNKKAAKPSMEVFSSVIREKQMARTAVGTEETAGTGEIAGTEETAEAEIAVEAAAEFVQKIRTPAIELREVSFAYRPGQFILDRFSFQGYQGSITLLKGESGAGKSTVLDLICGFLKADQGELFYWGNRSERCDIKIIRKAFGYMSQAPYFFNDTIIGNLAYVREDISRSEVEKINKECSGFFDEIMEYCEKPVGLFGSNLSGGMKQKLDFLRLLLSEAGVFLLDEPAASLDAASRNKLMVILKDQKSMGKTIVLVTHQTELEKWADSVYEVPGSRMEGSSNG